MQRYAFVHIKTQLRLDEGATESDDHSLKSRLEDLTHWGSMGYQLTHVTEISAGNTRTIYDTLQRASD